MSQIQISEHDREIIAESCRRSLSEFVKRFWSIVEPGTPLVWSWHMEAICEHLQEVTHGKFKKLIICIPPGFAKSLLVSVFWQAWEWTFHPTVRSMFGSYDESLTHRDSMKCRDILRSARYNKLFNPNWYIRRDQDSKSYFTNSLHGSRRTFFVGSQKITGWRGDRIVIDDPLSAKKRYDRNVKKEVVDTWDRVLSTRVNDPKNSSFVVIMQRLADDDLVGHLLRNSPDDYIQLILPNEYDPKRRCVTPIFVDPRTEQGELLFPQRYDAIETAVKRRELGEVDYQAQFQHNPFPEAGARFDSNHFLYWKWKAHDLMELHHRSGEIEYLRISRVPKFITVDVACSERRTADHTSIGLFAQTSNGDLILLHKVSIQANEGHVLEAIKNMFNFRQFGLTPPMWIGVEANGMGLPIAQNAKARGLPILPIHISNDKITSSATAVIRFQGGQIFIPDPSVASWIQDFIQQLLAFPSGEHDDDVTMLSLAANSVFESSMGIIGKLNGETYKESKIEPTPLERRVDKDKRRRFGLR